MVSFGKTIYNCWIFHLYHVYPRVSSPFLFAVGSKTFFFGGPPDLVNSKMAGALRLVNLG